MKEKLISLYLNYFLLIADKAYVVFTIILLMSLPLSPFAVSVSQFVLTGFYITEGGYIEKWKQLTHRKSVLIVLSLFLMHFLWLINTQNFAYAFHDIKIKLPLISLTIIYGTKRSFNHFEFILILYFYLLAVFISSLYSLYIFLGYSDTEIINYRNISPIISHIRFSLLVVLAIAVAFYLIYSQKTYSWKIKVLLSILILWFSLFLIMLGAMTGILIFLILIPVAILYFAGKSRKKRLKKFAYSLVILVLIAGICYLVYTIKRYTYKEIVDFNNLETYTPNGNKYHHYKKYDSYENGHRIWIYISHQELEKEWNKRSKLDYIGYDLAGQRLESTLIRYLSSLGYRKDSVGISKLSEEDIKMVEMGHTNHLRKHRLALYPRLYDLYWEIDFYRKTGNPSGHSLTQRIEYLKTAFRIIKENFWFGVGTGDVEDAFKLQYKKNYTPLEPKWQLRAHNQYITFLLTFGIFGFLWFIFILVYPVVYEKRKNNFLFWGFYLIALLSMINEDTLETQAGATFYAFFLTLFLFAQPRNDQ